MTGFQRLSLIKSETKWELMHTNSPERTNNLLLFTSPGVKVAGVGLETLVVAQDLTGAGSGHRRDQ